MDAGPHGGWSWDGSHGQVSVAIQPPPLKYLEPVALAMLSAWSGFQRLRHGRAVLLDSSAKSPLAYSTGLLGGLVGRQPQNRPGASFVRLALEQEEQIDALSDAIDSLGIAHDPTTRILLHCAEDLARNVFHHARAAWGGAHIAASYQRDRGVLRLGVADCGRGIPDNIRSVYGDTLSDEQSVLAAIEPNVSGTGIPGLNRGVGLFVVRRLALAGQGAFWLRTGSVQVSCTSGGPETIVPDLRVGGAPWQGTAVAITLRCDHIDDFFGAMRSVRDELEGRGPRFDDIRFYKHADEDERWSRISVAPDAAPLALDRVRAMGIANTRLEPLLRQGRCAIVDFSGIGVATQAFCHALLAETIRTFGPDVLERLRFVGCSRQVVPLIRMAVNDGIQDWIIPAEPPK